MRLFIRRWLLSIGPVDVSDLDLEFVVERSTAREPNTAEIRVYNLARDTRARIIQARDARVILRAGYEEDGDPPPMLFSGEVRRAWVEGEGVGSVLCVTSRDGGRAFVHGRISKSYNPGTPARAVLSDLVDAMGIGRGNLEEFAPAFALRTGSSVFADGFVADGPAHRVLTALARGAGLRWSVQNGALQLQRAGQALQSRAVVLSSDSGLVGSPTANEKGIVTATTLLQPGIDPGRIVILQSDFIAGNFEIRRASYRGSTLGADWHATLEMKALR